MSLQDRDYVHEDEATLRQNQQTRKAGNVDQMLQGLDLTNLPPCCQRSKFQRCMDWLRRLVGIRARRP